MTALDNLIVLKAAVLETQGRLSASELAKHCKLVVVTH